MKRKILPLFLLLSLCVTARAAETEPNNTKAQANTLALNGSSNGKIGNSTDVDWWKVTTTGDGKLDVTIVVSNGLYLWCQIYDNNGTIVLNQGYTSGTTTISKDGLATGTYYLKLYPYYSGEMPVYTISNVLTQPAQANDAEPDSTRAQAIVLPLNGKKTGHIGYYYNNHKDSVDWYKVTTNADGRLRLTMSSANGQNVWAYLFDNDGKTQLASGYTSGTAVVVNKDGLAAGTYYIRVNTYYTSEWAPYTLSDSLFSPIEPNDTEPDSTRAQALTLPLNGSKQGHINYYYDNHSDSVDWYKITANADGRLRLTVKSGNGQNVWAYLFDNDGKTQLAAGYTSGEAVVVNKDGLAAGTYYVRVNTYYTNEWASYTLSDSLFKASPANDTEPNDSKVQALTLPLNGSVTGHTNYYYKLKKDSTDWYKLTTDNDGMITITIQSFNGQNVWAYLFDNDGATVLASAYTTGTTSYSFDGLKAGTYYVRVNTYYTSEWAPYKLSNTLSTYSYAGDGNDEPNNDFKHAKTISSNTASSTGHVNFYYNGVADTVDYCKINYTGAGDLTLAFSQNNRLRYGSPDYTWFQVYKDTAASPIYSSYFTSPSGDINFTGLTQGYYYIKIFTYYNGKGEHFSSYSIKNTYTQKDKAKIAVTSTQASTDCAPTNSITYKLTKSHAPYRVQLYRYDSLYSKLTVSNSTATFDSLPEGSYYAVVYGDGATGKANSISTVVTFMPTPAGLSTAAIKTTQATLKWSALTCASYFSIQYRVTSSSTWTTIATNGNVSSYVLKGLTAGTSYQWKVASVDSANGTTVMSAYSSAASFTTKTALIADDENGNPDNISIAGKNTGNSLLAVAPNPASNYFIIKYNTVVKDKVTATLYAGNGKAVWNSGAINADALNNKQVNVSAFAAGLYYLEIIDSKGKAVGTIKVSVIK